MGGLDVDWEIESEVSRCSGGALSYDRIRRRLVFHGDDGPVEVTINEADLRNWMQVLLLSAWAPTQEGAAHEHAVRLILERALAHTERAEDPFASLRERQKRAERKQPPLAG